MTNAELIAKLKTEIERLKKDNEISEDKDYAQYEFDVACGYDMALDDILSLLDTLESEKPMNQDEELNEEIKKEITKLPFFLRGKDLIALTRHFARWGAEHARSEIMKEAIEGYITNAGGEFGYDVAAFRFDEYHTHTVLLPHEEGRKHGDKVCAIILPKED